MKQMVPALVLCLGLAACSSSNDSKSSKDGIHTDGGNETLENVTDYSRCQAGPAPRSIEGNWQSEMASKNLRLLFHFQVGRNSTRVTNDCSFHGRSLRASVLVPSMYTSQSLIIQRDDSDAQAINEPDFRLNCNVEIKAISADYRFNGSCLVLRVNGQEQTLVPAGF